MVFGAATSGTKAKAAVMGREGRISPVRMMLSMFESRFARAEIETLPRRRRRRW